MKIALVLETCDRRPMGGVNYVVETLRNLRRAGTFEDPAFHSLQVINGSAFDPEFSNTVGHELPVGGVLIDRSSRLTRLQTAQHTVKAGASTDAGWVLRLEDDLDVADDFLASVSRWLEIWGDEPVSTFALGGAMATTQTEAQMTSENVYLDATDAFPVVRAFMRGDASFVAQSAYGWYGSHALVWSRANAALLATWMGDDPSFSDGKERHRERGFDLMLQLWAHALGCPFFGVCVPSMIQHVGARSTLGNAFTNLPFVGRDRRYTKEGWVRA